MIETHRSPLNQWSDAPLPPGRIAVWWLGQAGFLFRTADYAWIIDPYLSDSLAAKYKDARFPHKRMAPIPIAPGDIKGLRWIFATHKHTDHMDVGTLPALAEANPEAAIIAPLSAAEHLAGIVPVDRNDRILLRQNDRIDLAPGITLTALPSAHEDFQQDDSGASIFLGYVLTVGGVTIYHSGDCAPYPGLARRLDELGVRIAMLPVNGRDAERKSHGVPGNFNFAEALDLCRQANIPSLVCHHFGMFDFNTADPQILKRRVASLPGDISVVIPEIDRVMLVSPE